MDRKVVEGVPINGKTFEAKVHKISNSGNGLVETTQTEINLGPVKDGAVGERIEAMKLPGPFARIKRPKSILKPNYIDELQAMISYDFSIDYGDAHGNISKHGLRKQEHIGAILEYVPDNSSSENSSKTEKSQSNEQNLTDDLSESEIEESTTDTLEMDNETTTTDSPVAGTGDAASAETASEESQSELSLDELRKRAKENEVEEITQTVSSMTTAKTQYNRSPEIKEYVKARADGYCEGCGEPAPFTSKSGDPYFHAHHVRELSNGGSDTVDMVIALCPNCHYRVHHGEDGKEYNQKLLEKIQRLENG